jgi:hypothetical protein
MMGLAERQECSHDLPIKNRGANVSFGSFASFHRMGSVTI